MMKEEEEGDFVSKKVSYMIQAIQGALPDDAIKSFGKVKTDAERFSFVWKLKEVHDVIALEKEFEEKSVELARIHREKGNAYFQKKSYLSALGEYNQSVIKAPTMKNDEVEGDQNGKIETDVSDGGKEGKETDQSQGDQVDSSTDGQNESKVSEKETKTDEKAKNELALAFANRSAALFHLKKYRDCLEDIRFALESGYPENLHQKMFERQGSCYLELGNSAEAIASFTRAKAHLTTANLDEKAMNSWLKSLNKHLEKCKQLDSKPEPDSAKTSNVPRLTGGPQNVYPNASNMVRIQYNNIIGRYATANQDIKVGDVLMVDTPFASVLFPRFHKTHCYHCFVRVPVPVPCTQCSSVIFCSRECREASWTKFHQYECQYFVLLDTSMCAKIGHLAVRLVMVQGLNTLLEFLRKRCQENDLPALEEVGKNGEGIYCSEYESVYDMVTNCSHRKAEELFDFTVSAALLVRVLQLSSYLQVPEDSPDFSLIGGVLLRHLQIIQCNAQRVLELQQPQKFNETRPAELGIGIYPTAALVNHSCDPVADLNFYDATIVVRAIRNIYEGEEIAISYGPLFYETKIARRKTQLKGAYYFHCRCPACKEHWPIIEEMFEESPKYRCENCRVNLTTEERFERKYFMCAKCQHKQDMEDVVCQLQTSYDAFATAMNDAMSGRSDDALPHFVQHLLLLQRYIRQPWRDFCACQSAIKLSYRLQGNTKQQ